MKNYLFAMGALSALTLNASAGPLAPATEADAFANVITPISNPTLTGNPLPRSNVHAIYINHELPDSVRAAGTEVPVGGEVNIYALQLEYAFNKRLSIIANKDGFVDLNPNATVAEGSGFANLAAGLKYAFIYDEPNQFVFSGSAVIEVPTGNREVFQGFGDGALHLVASGLKLHGNWQFTGVTGVRLPFNNNEESTTAFLSTHASYRLTQRFIPLVELNWFRVLDAGNGTGAPLGGALEFDGLDLLNFGSKGSSGNRDTVTLAAGARYEISNSIDIGAAYEIPLSGTNRGLTKSRFTFDLVYTF